ncbi:MAG: hypothetical protein PHQ23_09005, partial [Candidatus Wallbacteria bacterium]|nr:hypothetical protein [Candidatus Wallbacteria bacterium]
AGMMYYTWTYQNPCANGDSFKHDFYLAAGNYNFTVLGYNSTNRGKIDWYIDDVLKVSGQDWYGGGVMNIMMTSALTVDASGLHTLKGVVNGKNAASSSYYIVWTKAWFTKT